jgi:hypothetical protein
MTGHLKVGFELEISDIKTADTATIVYGDRVHWQDRYGDQARRALTYDQLRVMSDGTLLNSDGTVCMNSHRDSEGRRPRTESETTMNLNGKEVTDSVLQSMHDGPHTVQELYFFDQEDEDPELTDWLMTKSDLEGKEDYTGQLGYWTVEELEAKPRVLLMAIARDLRLEVPQGATKAQLLELILAEAEEYEDGEES